MATRLLAEWHPQDAIQLSWPSPHSDWSEMLESIEATCEAMVIAISRYQHVLISVSDDATRERLAARFAGFGLPAERLVECRRATEHFMQRKHGRSSNH